MNKKMNKERIEEQFKRIEEWIKVNTNNDKDLIYFIESSEQLIKSARAVDEEAYMLVCYEAIKKNARTYLPMPTVFKNLEGLF